MSNPPKPKYLEVSAGLLVGGILMASGIAWYNDQPILPVLTQPAFVFGFAGITLSLLIYWWQSTRKQ